MHREGHVGAALVAYAPIGALIVGVGATGPAVVGGAIAFGLAMLPDWDQRIPFIDHRGVTHTVHFAGVVGGILGLGGVVFGITAGIWASIALGVFGFVVGSLTILSHIAADALTPMGVKPFRDERHYSFDLVRAANPIANYLLLVIGILAVVLAYVAGVTMAELVGELPLFILNPK
jgi:inner membrane protein